MPLLPAGYQRVAIPESSHACVAVDRGFFGFGLMLGGPDHQPAAVLRQTLSGEYVLHFP